MMGQLDGRRIVLIGGAGFIGHHVALKLKRLGADVTIVDSLAVNNYYEFRDKEDLIPNGKLYLAILEQRLALLEEAGIPVLVEDARDYVNLSGTMVAAAPDTIIHLAAVAHAGKSNKDPYSTFDHSLRTLENALDIARSPSMDIKHFIYLSSSMVYGHFLAGVVDEETRCHPLGIYGALKYAGEKIVIAYNQVFDLPYTIVRPSALYGPRCVSRRVGQIFIENAMAELDVDISGDGSDALDFTHVGDFAHGIVCVLTHEESKGELFNLTYGESRSISTVADIITKHFPDVRINYLPKDELVPDRGTLSVEKARRLIGYEPCHPLEVGFVEYIEWYKSIWPMVNGAGQAER
jgi:nucleoside-diphosphate-sugar epimerase